MVMQARKETGKQKGRLERGGGPLREAPTQGGTNITARTETRYPGKGASLTETQTQT